MGDTKPAARPNREGRPQPSKQKHCNRRWRVVQGKVSVQAGGRRRNLPHWIAESPHRPGRAQPLTDIPHTTHTHMPKKPKTRRDGTGARREHVSSFVRCADARIADPFPWDFTFFAFLEPARGADHPCQMASRVLFRRNKAKMGIPKSRYADEKKTQCEIRDKNHF